jgi:hypothetical protein
VTNTRDLSQSHHGSVHDGGHTDFIVVQETKHTYTSVTLTPTARRAPFSMQRAVTFSYHSLAHCPTYSTMNPVIAAIVSHTYRARKVASTVPDFCTTTSRYSPTGVWAYRLFQAVILQRLVSHSCIWRISWKGLWCKRTCFFDGWEVRAVRSAPHAKTRFKLWCFPSWWKPCSNVSPQFRTKTHAPFAMQ